ncbi:MAG: beta-lactamase family protein [bacterium]|nr:beta-lactamase family protein [bacterium]
MRRPGSQFVEVVLLVALTSPACPLAGQPSPLRDIEPVAAVTADLEAYIPERMREADVPGLAIALIHGGEVVWEAGFGVTNTLTGEPVAPETLFEVASNSKVVTALVALRLVDAGRLSLDAPAGSYLPEPWLPPSEHRDKIIVRHLVSHSSGLPHAPFAKAIRFEPGTAYSYSAMGFEYLQEIIEQVTGQPLEQVAREMVFEPLHMSSSSFVATPELRSRTAHGHTSFLVPWLVFTIPYALALVVILLIGMVISRIARGRWRLTGKMLWACLVTALVLVLGGWYYLQRSFFPEFWWLMVECVAIFFGAWALLLFGGRRTIARLSGIGQRHGLRRGLHAAWAVGSLVALVFFATSRTNVPVPRWPFTEVSSAGTVRTTAGDLAAFLIELAAPRHLSEALAVELRTPQISPSEEISWGLGPGIQHSPQGDALWQWGQTLDFQSVMVIYPDQGFGVVVFTNSDVFRPLIVFDVAHRALGGEFEGIRRAARLELNR